VLVEQPEPRFLKTLALVTVGLVRHRDAQHAVRDRRAVDRRLELSFLFRDARLVLARQVPEEAFAGEAPKLGRRTLQLLGRLELRQFPP